MCLHSVWQLVLRPTCPGFSFRNSRFCTALISSERLCPHPSKEKCGICLEYSCDQKYTCDSPAAHWALHFLEVRAKTQAASRSKTVGSIVSNSNGPLTPGRRAEPKAEGPGGLHRLSLVSSLAHSTINKVLQISNPPHRLSPFQTCNFLIGPFLCELPASAQLKESASTKPVPGDVVVCLDPDGLKLASGGSVFLFSVVLHFTLTHFALDTAIGPPGGRAGIQVQKFIWQAIQAKSMKVQ